MSFSRAKKAIKKGITTEYKSNPKEISREENNMI